MFSKKAEKDYILKMVSHGKIKHTIACLVKKTGNKYISKTKLKLKRKRSRDLQKYLLKKKKKITE